MISNVQWLLIILLVLTTFFVLFGCKLKCKGVNYKKEGWTDQIRDHVSNPYFGDIFSDCETSLSVPRQIPTCDAAGMFGAADRSLPLTARAQQLAYYEQGQQDLAAMQALQGGQM